MSVEKRLFLGIKQMTKTAFLELQDSEKVGYIWFVRCEDPVHFEIYLGTNKYGETNETVEDLIREIAEKLKVAIGLTDDLTLPDDFQYENILDNLEKYGIRITDLEDRATSAETRIEILETNVSELSGSVIDIESKIPEEASSENQLADKQYVLDLIHSTSSAFRGNWETWYDVPTDVEEYPEDGEGNRTPRQGDYIVVNDSSAYIGEETGKTYEGVWSFVYEGEWNIREKDGWKPEYRINEEPEITVHFRKKREGREESEWISDVRVSDENMLLRYPELDYSEFVNGGYWDTNIATLRQLTAETTVYYITPFMTSADNRTLLKICFENGWSSSPDYITLSEVQSITDEMVAEAAKKLALIEDNNGNIIPVYDNIVYQEYEYIDDELVWYEPIPMARYNLYEGKCWDMDDNMYKLGLDSVNQYIFFYGTDGKKYNLKDVHYGNCFFELESWNELPDFTGITKLSDGETYRVFLNYSHIRDINLKNIASLPAYTLFRCTNLENIFIPSGLTDIETYAIASCDGLTVLIVDDNNPKYTSKNSQGIECNCILEKNADKLTLIQGCNISIIPDNITDIASGAFDECTEIHSITFYSQLKTIGDNVFRNCTGLNTKVTIPSTVTSIGESTFRGCTNLTTVECNVSQISNALFKDCTNLSDITLSNTTSIEYQAFMNDAALQSIVLPETLTSVGVSAFNNCSSLTSITIPDSVETIGNNVFESCSDLEIVTIGSTSSNLSVISNSAFRNCISLESVYLNGNNKINLASPTAFSGCDNLNEIIVPDNLVESYKESEDWAEYKDIIYGHSVYTVIFDENGGNTEYSEQHIRVGGKVQFPGTEYKDLYTFNYWADEDENEWDFDEDYVISGMTLYAHYSEVKAIMAKSISTGVTYITLNIRGGYLANVEYSYDGVIWDNFENGNSLTISINGEHSHVYFRGYNPNGFSRSDSNYTYFTADNGQCDLLGNIMYLKDYNEELDYVNYYEFYRLFQNCYAIVNTDKFKLPATTLAEYCYSNMFYNCSSLATVPELHATTLENYCYYNMFIACINLTTALELPATTLANGCYQGMFEGCRSLTTVPALPATELANSCYYGMFRDCTSLTTAPELPATALASDCYGNMFYGCASLTTAPELPATTLASYCYASMFEGCSGLNYIKCLAINGINTNNSTYRWVYGVQTNSGTFVKHPDATSWATGNSGIPTNWTVEDANAE